MRHPSNTPAANSTTARTPRGKSIAMQLALATSLAISVILMGLVWFNHATRLQPAVASTQVKIAAVVPATPAGRVVPSNAVLDTRPTIRFGIPPWQKSLTIDEVRQQYKPMLDWLGSQINHQFIIVGGQTYEKMVEMAGDGNVQLAVLSPVPFVMAKRRNPALELLVTETKWNDDKTKLIDSYTGHIITLKSRTELNTLADLKNTRFTFVNMDSSSGYRYPNAILKEQGIDSASYFQKVTFLGSHPRVTDALVEGSIDAGATWDFNLTQAIAKHGPVFKIILNTPPIPNLCVVAHPSLPTELRQQIKHCLLKIDPKLLIGSPAAGYIDRPDSFYDVVRTLVDSEQTPAGEK